MSIALGLCIRQSVLVVFELVLGRWLVGCSILDICWHHKEYAKTVCMNITH